MLRRVIATALLGAALLVGGLAGTASAAGQHDNSCYDGPKTMIVLSADSGCPGMH